MQNFKAFLFAAALVLPAVPALAHEVTIGDLIIGHPWSPATPGEAKNGVAFMIITDKGKTPDRLIKAASPIAATVELHTHMQENGVMKMRQVKSIDIKPGESVELKPGGLHVMLIGLKGPLKADQTYPLTFTFEKSGEVKFDVTVATMGAGELKHHDTSKHK